MKKANSFIFLICSILLICSLTSCKAKQEDVSSVNTMSEQEESEPGNSVSEQTKGDMTSFSASTLSGGTFTQEDLADYDMTVINIWATTCGYCIEEMEGLEKLYEQLPENVNFISICADAAYNIELAEEILKKKGATFETLIGNSSLDNAILQYITGTPTTVFTDSEGNLVGSPIIGAPCIEDMDRAASIYLKEVENHLKELDQ